MVVASRRDIKHADFADDADFSCNLNNNICRICGICVRHPQHADFADDADFSFNLNGNDNSNRKKWHICQKFRLE